jgi:hypothetical protein
VCALVCVCVCVCVCLLACVFDCLFVLLVDNVQMCVPFVEIRGSWLAYYVNDVKLKLVYMPVLECSLHILVSRLIA